jgi:hypothetical protein
MNRDSNIPIWSIITFGLCANQNLYLAHGLFLGHATRRDSGGKFSFPFLYLQKFMALPEIGDWRCTLCSVDWHVAGRI